MARSLEGLRDLRTRELITATKEQVQEGLLKPETASGFLKITAQQDKGYNEKMLRAAAKEAASSSGTWSGAI